MSKFELTEQEAHFLEHTRILTKNKKCYQGKRKPVPIDLPEQITVPRPMVTKGVFKYWCYDCFEEYVDWGSHQESCNPKPFAEVLCEQCNIMVDPWNHWRQTHQPTNVQRKSYQPIPYTKRMYWCELGMATTMKQQRLKRPTSNKYRKELSDIRKELQRRRNSPNSPNVTALDIKYT